MSSKKMDEYTERKSFSSCSGGGSKRSRSLRKKFFAFVFNAVAIKPSSRNVLSFAHGAFMLYVNKDDRLIELVGHPSIHVMRTFVPMGQLSMATRGHRVYFQVRLMNLANGQVGIADPEKLKGLTSSQVAGPGVGDEPSSYAIDMRGRIWHDKKIVYEATAGLARGDVITVSYDGSRPNKPRLTFYVNSQDLYACDVAPGVTYQPAFSLTPCQWLRFMESPIDVPPGLLASRSAFLPLTVQPPPASLDSKHFTASLATSDHFRALTGKEAPWTLRASKGTNAVSENELLLWRCVGGSLQRSSLGPIHDHVYEYAHDGERVDRSTLLHMAAHVGNADVVSHLLSGTTGPKKCPIDGTRKTPLHMAARSGLDQVLERLVEHYGPEHIDALDHKGRSALWFALANNHVRCVAVLLKHNAALQLVDALGENAEEIARCHLDPDEWERHELRSLLASRSDDENVRLLQEMKDKGAVHMAISSDTLDLLRGLYMLRRVGQFAWAELDGDKGSKREFQVALTEEDLCTLCDEMQDTH